ncbi:hypothetical protein Ddye_028438 [Dipteronia dyeriana]|uniref:Disease resistance protein At4g27190-like leucine-rich repeats domain-containing protein n=1 Tax=Dipteronia dyeriana TaxID=168575 RepID=A0AAD9TRY0_9ROSI|nr:hypothetical protein Ddye_028438 [Dipteronia dyeriana]
MVLFPNLDAFELSAINVEKIWLNQLPANCMQNLTHLILQGCGNLKNLFSSSIVNGFVQLQYLEICKCTVLEHIVVIEDLREGESNDILFPQLNYLTIEDLGNLKRFYSGHHIEFSSLKQLKIEKCPKMKAFILTNISSDITAGKDVEKMNSVENQESTNGESLNVSLKYLFHASIARSLLHLEKLYVENCGVEEIVGKEESEATARFVLFPRLIFLKLWTLPELKAFYPGAHTSG